MLNTSLQATSPSDKHVTQLTTKAHHPSLISVYECYAVSPNRHLSAPPPPRLTVRLLAMMMKLNYIGGTIPDFIRLTWHKAQYTITTLTGNIYLGY